MFIPEFWSRLDAAAGVPVELAVRNSASITQRGIETTELSDEAANIVQSQPDNTVISACLSTKAPLIYARRNHAASDDALRHIELAVRQTFREFGVVLTEGAVRTPDTETLLIDVSDEALWYTPLLPYLDVLAARGHDIRITEPDVGIAKQRMTWRECTTQIGEDAALWATLNAANAKPPFTISGDLKILASRRDENPLALIRRAHAACVIRLDATSTCTSDAHVGRHETDTYLRSTLVWANRVSYDTKRHGRTRPLTLALNDVAHAVIRHGEKPVTRTDSLALEVARTLFARSLMSVNIAAPVPA